MCRPLFLRSAAALPNDALRRESPALVYGGIITVVPLPSHTRRQSDPADRTAGGPFVKSVRRTLIFDTGEWQWKSGLERTFFRRGRWMRSRPWNVWPAWDFARWIPTSEIGFTPA